jgi:hypothetical protein
MASIWKVPWVAKLVVQVAVAVLAAPAVRACVEQPVMSTGVPVVFWNSTEPWVGVPVELGVLSVTVAVKVTLAPCPPGLGAPTTDVVVEAAVTFSPPLSVPFESANVELPVYAAVTG